jgi:hypothetical protein
MKEFYENFYKMCSATGIVEQLVTAGYLTDFTTISPVGAEQILKSKFKENVGFTEIYRSKFKKNNIGIVGKTGDPSSVSNKLNRFVLQYGYSEDVILEATDLYIKSVDNPTYIMQADYFIFKRDGFKSEEKSMLASFCEQVVDNRDGEGEIKSYGDTL